MTIYFFIGFALAALVDLVKSARKNKRKQLPPAPVVVDWEPVEDEPDGTELDLSVPFCGELEEVEEYPAVLLARADIDRYEAIKGVYIDLLDALEEETHAIEREFKSPEITDKRRSTLAHRLTAIKSKEATTTAKVYAIDRQIEKAYSIAVA